MADVTVIDHPLIQHKLTLLRKKETGTGQFRVLVREISMLLAYEVTRDIPLKKVRIQTPLVAMDAPVLDGKKLVVVSILRAGNAILEGMLELVPSARVGHIGLYREPNTLQVVEYYLKLPDDLPNREVLLVDPMLATGNSAVAAVNRLKDAEVRKLKYVCLLAAPEGIDHMQNKHPDIPIFTAAIDERLDEHGYILPGLGDAGDRVFGTK